LGQYPVCELEATLRQWERVKQWIPPWRRSPLDGPRRLDYRRAFAGIVYRLRTGCQWDAIPREFGSGSTCYRRFVEWVQADAFGKIHAEALCYYRDKVGLDLEWASLDSASVKAPKGGTSRAPVRPIVKNSAQNATF
jgi:putative transposase